MKRGSSTPTKCDKWKIRTPQEWRRTCLQCSVKVNRNQYFNHYSSDIFFYFALSSMGAFGVLGFGMMSQSRLRLIDVSIKRQTLQKRDIQLLQHRVNNICGSLT